MAEKAADKGYKPYDPETTYFADEDVSAGMAGKARHAVRTRPLTMMAVSAGVGFVIGYTFGRGSGSA